MAYLDDLVKAAHPTGGMGLPPEWATATFAPGWPIRPLEQPQDEDVSGIQIPRAVDYQVAVNVSINPRTHYGLMPFSGLADAFENVAEVKLCVSTITREMSMFVPQLVDLDGNPVDGHDYQWLIESPDRETPWVVWLYRFLESREIFDAGAVYIHKDESGYLKGLRYLDGSTLFLLVDEHGNPPPAKIHELKDGSLIIPPAFVQVIKGMPFGFYDQSQIWYRPAFRRYNAPYGMPPQEMEWIYVLILANISGFALSFYREGNLPEGFFTAPQHWTLRQVDSFESALTSRMSSGPAERRRARVFPYDFKWTQTKAADFPKVLYDLARDNLSLAYGIPPSEFGKMPGGGLGGKGFMDAAQMTLFRMGLAPRKAYVEGFFNELLKRFNITDVTFKLAFPGESIDPDKQKKGVIEQFSNGIISFNEARSAMGFDPIKGGDIHLVVRNSTVTVLEAYFNTDSKEFRIQQPGGAVAGSATTGSQAIAGSSKETFADARDNKLAEDLLRRGAVPLPKFGIVMPDWRRRSNSPVRRLRGRRVTKAEYEPGQLCPYQDCCHDLALPGEGWYRCGYCGRAFYARDSDSDYEDYACYPDGEAQDYGYGEPEGEPPVARDLGPSWGTPRSAGGTYEPDAALSALDGALDILKHCGVCEEDDDWYMGRIALEGEIDMLQQGANDSEIVAIVPDGLEPRPAVWKPEGGEDDGLRERVGGKLYPREEAAYLVDRSMRFYLVPVAYGYQKDSEWGAVSMYVKENQTPRPATSYAPLWIEKGAVLDYVCGQVDRSGHNWLTHPDEKDRPILFDNGLAFPTEEKLVRSAFCRAWIGKSLSNDVTLALRVLKGDRAVWRDIETLVGLDAAQLAQNRVAELLDEGEIPVGKVEEVTTGS